MGSSVSTHRDVWARALATVILHSRAGDVAPSSDSVELVRISGLTSDSLIEVGTERQLAELESLKAMLEAVDKAIIVQGN